MGLGKTIQVIGYLNLTRPASVLIVCPNNLRLNWISEIDKWMDPSLREKFDLDQCTPSLYMPTNLIICSYEGLTRWAGALVKEPWDVLIVDEAHYIKNRATKRAKALFRFHDHPCKKILLTGTPICNYPYELFPLVHFLDPRQWPSEGAFNGRYCPYGNKYGYHLAELQEFLRQGTHFKTTKLVAHRRVVKTGHSSTNTYLCQCGYVPENETQGVEHVGTTGHDLEITRAAHETLVQVIEKEVEEIVNERGVGLMIRRLKKEVLTELPRKRRQIIELPAEGELLALVEKENALWKKHADIERELRDLLGLTTETSETDNDFERAIENMRFNRKYFFEEIAIIRHALARAKVPYVNEHLDDLLEAKDKVVCFVHHNDVGEAIRDRFADRAVLVYGPMNMSDRQEAIKRFWSDDKCELFIGSLKVAGLGINLQNAANVVFAELDWVPGVITQAEDRCHRIGQEKSLLVQHLVAQNSMDSSMAKKIVAKQKSIQKALNRQEIPK